MLVIKALCFLFPYEHLNLPWTGRKILPNITERLLSLSFQRFKRERIGRVRKINQHIRGEGARRSLPETRWSRRGPLRTRNSRHGREAETKASPTAGLTATSAYEEMGGSHPGWNHLTRGIDHLTRRTQGAGIVKGWKEKREWAHCRYIHAKQK